MIQVVWDLWVIIKMIKQTNPPLIVKALYIPETKEDLIQKITSTLQAVLRNLLLQLEDRIFLLSSSKIKS
jgi:hypothetical protein